MGKEERMFKKEMDMQEPYSESSDENIDRDLARKEYGNLPSNVIPEDYYQYKKFVNLPESQAEFEHKIDKDVVFGNFGGSKPDFEELCFDIGTIELFEGMFVIPHRVELTDENGEFVLDNNKQKIVRIINVFDEDFRDSLNFLKGRYKFRVVGSRAIGDTRASMLDISTNQNIKKEFSKKQDSKNSLVGMGGK